MDAREQLQALWVATFGGPPPVEGSPELLSRVLVQCLPPAPPYGSLGAPAPDEADSDARAA